MTESPSGAADFGLDTDAVTGWIRTLDIGAQEPLAYERVGVGQSNLTFQVTDATGRRWVLRRPPLGHLLASAHDVAREHRILSALQGSDVPVVTVRGLCEDPAVTDVPLMLVDFVDGIVIEDEGDAERLTADQRREMGLSLARTLAQLHSVDIDAVGLADLASHKPYAARQLRRWAGQWEQSKTRELPEFDRLTRRLTASMPQPGEIRLVHGDAHIRNVIARESGEVAALIDWELSTLGDPLADFGSTLAYWAQAGDPPSWRSKATTLEGFPSHEELTAAYAQESGRDMADLGFWHALGLWKIAAIIEGVRRRQIDEPRNTAKTGAIPAEAVDQIVLIGHQVADRAGLVEDAEIPASDG
ncbi:phosphotransferase family protein [Actinomycetota bacterium]